MATETKSKKPKARYIKCVGGPWPNLRIEAGLEPREFVPCGNRTGYRLTIDAHEAIYEWGPA